MKELLSKFGLDVTELSKRFGVSRPTTYKYIDHFKTGRIDSIPEKYRSFFEMISHDVLPSEEEVRQFLLHIFPTEIESGVIDSDRALEDIIWKFCDEKQTKYNILPIVLPTGSRKTTSIVNFIAKYIAEGGTKRIFFVTTLKKNLPINEDPAEDQLRKCFDEQGIGALYDEKVMMVDSLARMLYYNYPKLTAREKISSKYILGQKMVGELEALFTSLNGLDESHSAFKQLFDRFREFDSRVRGVIANKLSFKTKNPDEKYRIVTTDNDWSWISKVYPTVFTNNRQVFLMSMDKFISIHDTIVDGRYALYNSKLLDGAFVVIDEFDATKETVLRSIIDNDQMNVDYVGIFRRIYRTLEHNSDIWKQYYRGSPEDECEKSLAESVEEIYKNAQALAEDFNLDVDFKLAESKNVTYIFRDNRLIKTGGNREFYIEHDPEQRINFIRSIDVSDKNAESKIPRNRKGFKLTITSMLGRMYGLFRHFESVMNILALNQYSIAESEGQPITRDAAIKTVLTPYDFNDEQVKYLVNAIKFRPPKLEKQTSHAPDTSFYEIGFEMFNFIDNDDHNLATRIYCTSMKRTPEKMLMMVLDHSHNAKVVGVSATTRLRSVIGNYDFRYLRSQKDYREYPIDQADRIRLKDMFAKTVDHYDRVNIVTDLITGKTPIKELIENKQTALDAETMMESFKESPYIRTRYVRVLEAYRRFLDYEDIRSMLCFMNVFPKEKKDRESDEFCTDFLKKLMSQMVKDHISKFKTEGKVVPNYLEPLVSEPFYVMRSADFDRGKDNLLKRLASGEKIFVMTTYATVGAGQNLQYTIPTSVQGNIRYISSLADSERFNSKDFDAVYLDMPTHVRPKVEEDDKSSLLAAIFSIESLQENHEIDIRGAKTEIERAFQEYYGIHAPSKRKKILEYSSYRMAYARRIIQAVGRICRTFAKNANVYIFADDALGSVFKGTSLKDFTDPNDPSKNLGERMANPEFKAILKELQNSEYECNTSVEEMIDNESVKTKAYIESMLKNRIWSKNSMVGWNSIREFVLRFPTVPADSRLVLVYNMYSKIEISNSIRYRHEDDYRRVYIDENGDFEVSDKDARLFDLMKIPSVKPLFGDPVKMDLSKMPTDEDLLQIPYASRFADNSAIMCPVLYHNIYKGALGEKSGKAILESWGFTVDEITDSAKFEKFDFVTDTEVYIDFKYWATSGNIDDESLIKKSFRKLLAIGGRKAVIINILKPTEGKVHAMGYSLKGEDHSFEKDGVFYDFSDLTLVTIPYLYDCNGDEAIENMEAHKTLQKVIGNE